MKADATVAPGAEVATYRRYEDRALDALSEWQIDGYQCPVCFEMFPGSQADLAEVHMTNTGHGLVPKPSEAISVDCNESGYEWVEWIEGRWLVDPDVQDEDVQQRGVALTIDGRLAFYLREPFCETGLLTYYADHESALAMLPPAMATTVRDLVIASASRR